MIQKYLEINEWMQETILVYIIRFLCNMVFVIFENVVGLHSCECSLNHSINTMNSQAV